MLAALARPHRIKQSHRRRRRIASGVRDYNYFRDYEPGTGRYVESDPMGLGGGLDTYAYVDGSPLNGIDPDGEGPFFPSCNSGGCHSPAPIPFPGPGPRPAPSPGFPGFSVPLPGGLLIPLIQEMCKEKTCPPCTPYAVGDLGYQGPKVSQQGIDKGVPHYILFQVQQIQSTCECIWKENTKGIMGGHHSPTAMGVDLNGLPRPPPYPGR